MLSIFTTNYLQTYNGFTWLLVSLSCDFNLLKEASFVSNSELAEITEDYQIRRRKEGTRRLISRLKMALLNVLLLGMMVVTLVGTFQHRKGDHWCTVVGLMVVLSSFVPLGVFGIAMYYYAGRFWDPDIPLAVPTTPLRANSD
jgi:Na+/melibiose symporter-like transporter